MIDSIDKLKFLKEYKNKKPDKQLDLFKNIFKVYQVVDNPNVLFKITSDWEGNWLKGCWYNDNKIINSIDEVFLLLPKSAIFEFTCNLDVIKEISSFEKFLYNNEQILYITYIN